MLPAELCAFDPEVGPDPASLVASTFDRFSISMPQGPACAAVILSTSSAPPAIIVLIIIFGLLLRVSVQNHDFAYEKETEYRAARSASSDGGRATRRASAN